MQSEELTHFTVTALDEFKAIDIRVLDVREMTTVTDFMIVASGRSDRHVRALGDNLVRKAKKEGHAPLGVEGEREGEWILVDLCDVVVHIMLPEIREFYQLEKLWGTPDTKREVSP